MADLLQKVERFLFSYFLPYFSTTSPGPPGKTKTHISICSNHERRRLSKLKSETVKQLIQYHSSLKLPGNLEKSSLNDNESRRCIDSTWTLLPAAMWTSLHPFLTLRPCWGKFRVKPKAFWTIQAHHMHKMSKNTSPPLLKGLALPLGGGFGSPPSPPPNLSLSSNSFNCCCISTTINFM